ncbi:hypothetical protein QVD17_19163 [Tagetes erecta]|uniref:Uncharacterized protein n=1 Tax=Tagetes erecta TaxID=13708 RepID=A0AAD8KJ11_TARER|nr:hypothetical protein QVD17_19163 [Tagetes erecta]
MSGLIDIWTSELKKLHNNINKAQTHGSNPSDPESPTQYSIWSQALIKRVNSVSSQFPAAASFSEASVSFSP